MNMYWLTILQFASLFASYALVTLFLPAIVYGPMVRKYTITTRFMLYFIIGNFTVMNEVFLLELLHISCRFSLILVYVVFQVLSYFWIRRANPVDALEARLDMLRKLLEGHMGVRSFLKRYRITWRQRRQHMAAWFRKYVLLRLPEVVLILGTLMWTVYIFGSQYLEQYGYTASDLVVHHWWINELKQNNLFADGVYPFGYHVTIYFLSMVFGIETMTFMRLFGLVQVVYIVWMLLGFVAGIAKTRYAAFLTGVVYIGTTLWSANCFARFYAPLPQEFGMMFILPSLHFVLLFFREKQAQIQAQKRDCWICYPPAQKKRGLEPEAPEWMLVYFALAFSMTLAVHFYDTIIAGIACVGIAFGFLWRFLHRQYFLPIMVAGICSIFLAVYPMVIAYGMGTPIQGSLEWGLSVMQGEATDAENSQLQYQQIAEENIQEGDTVYFDSEGNIIYIERADGSVEDATQSSTIDTTDGQTADVETPGMMERLKTKWTTVESKVKSYVTSFLSTFQNSYKEDLDSALFYKGDSATTDFWSNLPVEYGIGALILAGFLLGMVLKLKDGTYGCILVSISWTNVFLTLLLMATELGLPVLIDMNRTRYYYVYFLSAEAALVVDATLYLLLGWKYLRIPMQVASLLVVSLAITSVYHFGVMNVPGSATSLETNGSMICTNSIMESHDTDDWVIISPNDETQMVTGSGYHSETITLLRAMEDYSKDSYYAESAEYIYVYVEKIPVDYDGTYEGSGQSVSEEGASQALPSGTGLDIYELENRWIIMSHMYYWAQSFQKLYPDMVQVYYEDDTFVCYEIHQSMSTPLNLAIDYGFNATETTGEGTE